jgi:hypothetical protein
MICKQESCEGELTLLNTDSRQEWCEEELICTLCKTTYIRRTEFDQNGLVLSDKVTEEK